MKVDFSYKENPLKVTYDIEATPNLFTLAMIHDYAMTLIIFGDEQFDDLYNDDLVRQMRDFASKEKNMKMLGISNVDELEYNVMHYKVGNVADMKEFAQVMQRMQTCAKLPSDVHFDQHPNAEYHGWNSARYDLPMIVCIKLLARTLGENLRPQHIRKISNAIIHFDGRPYEFPKHLQEYMDGLIRANEFRRERNIAIWFDGHLDWAAIARQQDGGEESQYPPGLKGEMAKFGLDIIIDESVGDNTERIWSKEEKEDLVEYNFNDVLGTRQISKNKILVGWLVSRDIVRRMYPYTAARAVPFDKLEFVDPPERDCSAANLAGLVLVGPNKVRPIDWEKVQYIFPVPDGHGGLKKVDLLEYMKENEKFMHEDMYAFFDHFRNTDTRKNGDFFKIKQSQPITHGPIMNLPYYKDGKPTDFVISVSCGGAHGFPKIGLRNFTEQQVSEWIRSKTGPTAEEAPTIDVKNIVHADWSSFYPVMTSKMQLYVGADGVDRIIEMFNRRMEIKDIITANPDRSKWTEELKNLNEEQMGIKFVMNNATGAGNQHNPHALLPVDNKTLSMRLIGNMLIWCLAQRITQEGGAVISTNTDGIYFANVPLEKAEKIVREYVDMYGMEVEPEPLERFINRDVSNRIEFVNGHRNIVSGRLRWGNFLEYKDDSIGRSATYPIASCYAALEYMNDPDWLQKPYDKSFIRELLKEVAENDEYGLQPWYHVHKAKSTSLTLDDEPLQKVNRIVMVKEGPTMGTISYKSPSKDDRAKIYCDVKNGVAKTLDDLVLFEKDIVVTEEEFYDQPRSEEYDYSTIELKTKTKYIKRRKIRPVFENIDKLDTSATIKMLKKTVDFKGNDVYEVVPDFAVNDIEFYHHTAKAFDAQYIGYPLKSNKDEYAPLKMLKRGTTVTGYTSNICKVVNTAKEVEEFDRSELDLEAYALWAEDLLSGWKVSADFPALNMKKVDDFVGGSKKAASSSKKLSKKGLALQILSDLYSGMREQLLEASESASA